MSINRLGFFFPDSIHEAHFIAKCAEAVIYVHFRKDGGTFRVWPGGRVEMLSPRQTERLKKRAERAYG